MGNWDNTTQARQMVQRSIEVTLRLGLILLLLLWGFRIVSPFIDLLAWAAILAVALYPVCQWLSSKLGISEKTAAIVITALLTLLIVVPSFKFAASSVETAREVATEWQEGTLKVPAPTEKVKSWPLIGEKVYAVWLPASQDLEATAHKFHEQIKEAGSIALRAIASSGATILKFAFATIIAGVFMASAEAMTAFMTRLSRRLTGEKGDHYVQLATATVRSVAQGVLGIAVIQATASAIGLVVMGIPLAGLWAGLVLMCAVVQLPPLLVLGPLAAYAFSAYDTTSATLFAIFALVVSISDTFLKPLLLGRGVSVPMLVILLGAIGGMIVSGIIGLFVGAVVLALIYQLFIEWLDQQLVTQESDSD